jgi:hypothetical protein
MPYHLCYNSLPSLPSLPSSSFFLAFILQHLPSDYLIFVLLKCGWRQREAQNENERWWKPIERTVWGSRIKQPSSRGYRAGSATTCRHQDVYPPRIPTLHFPISCKRVVPTTRRRKSSSPFFLFVMISFYTVQLKVCMLQGDMSLILLVA